MMFPMIEGSEDGIEVGLARRAMIFVREEGRESLSSWSALGFLEDERGERRGSGGGDEIILEDPGRLGKTRVTERRVYEGFEEGSVPPVTGAVKQ